MTLIKRIGLILMTAVVAIAIASSLLNSLSEPQVTTRLQLYQTDLLLQATEWQGEDMGVAPADVQRLQQALLGKEPVQATIKQYSAVKAEAQNNLSQSESKISELLPSDFANASESRPTRLQAAADQQARLIQQLDLRLGLLHAESGDTKAAIAPGKTLPPPADPWGKPPTCWRRCGSSHLQSNRLLNHCCRKI